MLTEESEIGKEDGKARGFLMTFSTLVLLAWYFDAQISQISILGSAIKLNANVQNIWLIMAIANLYLFFRYAQSLPPKSLKPDTLMYQCYVKSLISFSTMIYSSKLKQAALDSLDNDNEHDVILNKIWPYGSMKYTPGGDTTEDIFLETSPQRAQRINIIQYQIPYSYRDKNGQDCWSTGTDIEVNPHLLVIWSARIYGWIKGSIFTPWVFERALPIAYGLGAVAVSLCAWYGSLRC